MGVFVCDIEGARIMEVFVCDIEGAWFNGCVFI